MKYSTFILILWLFSTRIFAAEFAVSPMMIELESSPRVIENFSFQVFGKTAGEVKVTAWDMEQQLTGHMGFVEVNGDQEKLSSWIQLDNPTFSVKKDESVEVTGNVTIPPWANGSYHTAVMVEEARAPDAQGVVVNVRYAVILNIRVEGKKSRIRSGFSDLRLINQDGEFYIAGRFVNNSNRDYRLHSKAQVRSDDNKLLGRVLLKTQSAWQRGDEASRVFPGAEVEVFGLLTKPLPAGNYQAMVRNRFGGRHQPTWRAPVNVTSEMAKGMQGDAKSLPEGVALLRDPVLKVRRGGYASTSVMLVNNQDQAVEIRFPSSADQDLLSEYRFTPEVLKLQPSQRGMVILNQKYKDERDVQPVKFLAQVVGGEQVEWLEIPTQL